MLPFDGWKTPGLFFGRPRRRARRGGVRLCCEPLERREVLTVTFHGSAYSEPDLIPHVKIQAMYFGSSWQESSYFNQTGQLETYLQYVVQSPFMDLLTNLGYRVGRGSFDAGVIDPTVLDTTQYVFATPVAGERQNSVTEELQSYIDSGFLKQPDLDRVYVVYVQPNVAINDGFGHTSERSNTSQEGDLGFHSFFNGHDRSGRAATIRYIVISYPGGTYNYTSASQGFANDFEWLTSLASHEIAEAVTDPGHGSNFYGWYQGVTTGEVADLSVGKYARLNGYVVQQIADMNGMAHSPNGAPQVSIPPEGAFTYLENGTAVRVAPGTVVGSTGSSGLSGGNLRVAVTANASTNDWLQIANQGVGSGQIGISGSTVSYGGTAIGSFAGGVGATPLVVSFNGNASAAAVQALARQITFQAPGPQPFAARRTVSFQVTNSDGYSSSAATVAIDVVAMKSSAGTARLYRAYNPNADLHVFTSNFGEFAYLVTHGLRDETTGQSGFAVLNDFIAGTTAMHRLYNPNNGEHYYTLSDIERDVLVQAGWNFEKEEGYMYPVDASQPAGTTEIFRLYNNTSNHGEHLFTEDATYKDAVLRLFPGVWVVNSSLGYAYQQAASPAVSVTSVPVSSAATLDTVLTAAGMQEPDESPIAAAGDMVTYIDHEFACRKLSAHGPLTRDHTATRYRSQLSPRS